MDNFSNHTDLDGCLLRVHSACGNKHVLIDLFKDADGFMLRIFDASQTATPEPAAVFGGTLDQLRELVDTPHRKHAVCLTPEHLGSVVKPAHWDTKDRSLCAVTNHHDYGSEVLALFFHDRGYVWTFQLAKHLIKKACPDLWLTDTK